MQSKNQIIVISGILALLATVIVAGSYNIQTVKAVSTRDNNLGQNIISPRATGQQGCPVVNPTGNCNTSNSNGKGLGSFVSGKAHEGGFGGTISCLATHGGKTEGCLPG